MSGLGAGAWLEAVSLELVALFSVRKQNDDQTGIQKLNQTSSLDGYPGHGAAGNPGYRRREPYC